MRDEILFALKKELQLKSPLRHKQIDNIFSNMPSFIQEMLTSFLEYKLYKGCSLKYLAESYLFLCRETMKEQLYFQKTQQYRYSTYIDLEKMVYQNKEYMDKYMTGLLISTGLWENHRKIYEFFYNFIKGKKFHGGGLEIGPGHGVFFSLTLMNTDLPYYEAVDISEFSIEMTKDILSFRNINKKCNLYCGDFLHFNTEKQYGLIVAGEVLEHLEFPDTFLRKIRSLSNEETEVYISTCLNAPEIDHIYLFSDLDQIENIFYKTGFSIKEKLIIPYSGKNLEDCIQEKLPVNVAYILAITQGRI